MRRLGALGLVLFLWGCGPNDERDGSDFLKAASDFGISLYADSALPVKYVLSWQNPHETNGFRGTRIFLDTTDWKNVVKDHDRAAGPSFFVPPNGEDRDSILFSLNSGGAEVDSLGLYNGIPYYQLDSSGHLDSANFEFNLALISVYSGSDGRAQFTPLIVDDRFKPNPVPPIVEFTDVSIHLNWIRPRDPTSFFDAEADTGVIAGYHLILREVLDPDDSLHVPLQLDSITFTSFTDTLLLVPGQSLPQGARLTIIDTTLSVTVIAFLPDGNYHQTLGADENQLRLSLYGLNPLQKYDLQVYAEDTNGNLGKNDAELITLSMTDTSRPTIPALSLVTDSLTQNNIQVRWSSSRDTRPGDGSANANIKEYHVVRRVFQGDSSNGIFKDTIENIFNLSEVRNQRLRQNQSVFFFDAGEEFFVGTYYFLPPGTFYEISVWAVDSTEHRSDTSRMVVRTPRVDTTIFCPEGFVPVPSGNGISSAFCIQEYEYRDSSDAFVTNVDVNQARALCRAQAPGADLCTESQWLRSCRGSNETYPHEYGIQSITQDTGLEDIALPNTILQSHCNQAANDKEMALTPDLRNEICVTNEGVFDLAGNLSEWVLSDSSSNELIFKGGNYLKPDQDIALTRSQALCTYRGKPRQKRPKFAPGCLAETRQVALVYRKPGGLDTAYCPQFPDVVTAVSVPRDSLEMEVTLSGGDTEMYTLVDSTDSARFNPPRIVFYDSLVITYFTETNPDSTGPRTFPDTLAYIDFVNSTIPLALDSTPSDHPVLTREINTDHWEARPAQKIYGYLPPPPQGQPAHSKPAKPFYSSVVVAPRCCIPAVTD